VSRNAIVMAMFAILTIQLISIGTAINHQTSEIASVYTFFQTCSRA
jgi:hypothetical protein